MEIVTNAWCNFTYRAPPGRDDIGDLPVQRERRENGDRVVRSFWKPSAEEIEQLQRGGTIVLGILNNEPIPPVSLGIEFPP